MPDAYHAVHEFFSLVELIILHVALLAFLVVGIWRILKREIAQACKPVDTGGEIRRQATGEAAQMKT